MKFMYNRQQLDDIAITLGSTIGLMRGILFTKSIQSQGMIDSVEQCIDELERICHEVIWKGEFYHEDQDKKPTGTMGTTKQKERETQTEVHPVQGEL